MTGQDEALAKHLYGTSNNLLLLIQLRINANLSISNVIYNYKMCKSYIVVLKKYEIYY